MNHERNEMLSQVWQAAITAISLACIPLVVVISGAAKNPFLFNFAWCMAIAAVCFIVLATKHQQFWSDQLYRSAVRSHLKKLHLLGFVIVSLDFALLAWSTQFVDVSVSAIIFLGLLPIFYMLRLPWSASLGQETESSEEETESSEEETESSEEETESSAGNGGGRIRRVGDYLKNNWSISPFLLLTLLGLFFVISSESGNLSPYVSREVFFGVGLALLASWMGCSRITDYWYWGELLYGWEFNRLNDSAQENDEEEQWRHHRHLKTFGILFVFMVSSFAGGLISLFIGVGVEWFWPDFWSGTLSASIFLGMLPPLIFGAVVLVAAVHQIGDPDSWEASAKVFAYLAPGVGLFLLWLAAFLMVGLFQWLIPFLWYPAFLWLTPFPGVEVKGGAYLVIGTTAVILANIIQGMREQDAERRYLDFNWLILSLFLCGVWVYLRNGDGWELVASSDNYVNILFLSSTVYALILSFRTVRLVNRAQEEDNLALKLFRQLEDLSERGIIGVPVTQIYKEIRRMDENQDVDLLSPYVEIRYSIDVALENARLENANRKDREQLLKVSIDLDVLAHSRQKGIQFGELLALGIFAGLIVGTALLARPPGSQGLSGFIIELFAQVLSSVVIFLCVSVFFLERDRERQILKKRDSPSLAEAEYDERGRLVYEERYYQVFFPEFANEKEVLFLKTKVGWGIDELIYTVLTVGLIIVFTGLFLHKWELWPQIQAWASGFFL